jgi:quercetin dioxygenase-like cupin family protein
MEIGDNATTRDGSIFNGDPPEGSPHRGGEMSSDSTNTNANNEASGIRWARRAETVGFSAVPGITIQPVIGDAMMTCWIAMEPGTVVAEHSHPNEQSGVVIEGSVTITAAGESNTLEVGDAYLVTSDVPHRGVAGPRGALLVETFVPAREDYVRAWKAAAGS